MTEPILAKFVEVAVAGGMSEANKYMRAGYKLLHIEGIATASKRPDSNEYYIKRRASFILGRTEDVAHIDPPVYVPAQTAAAAAAS